MPPTKLTTPSPILRIPLEILCEILRYFRPVSPNNCHFNLYLDIVSASFVCTQWHQVASIMFPTELFEGLLEFSAGECTVKNLIRLTDLIVESRLLRLATFEQVRGVQLAFSSLLAASPKCKVPFMSQQINQIFKVLETNLTELGLDFTKITHMDESVFSILVNLAPHCRHVSRLTLCSWSAPRSQLYAISPLLAWLKPTLRSVTLRNTSSSLEPTLTVCQHVTMLTVSGNTLFNNLHLCSLAPLWPNLDTLRVTSDVFDHYLLLTHVLPCCHRLHTLTILSNAPYPGNGADPVIQDSYHSLRRVTISGNTRLARLFLALLFQQASTPLEHLRLQNCGKLRPFWTSQSQLNARGLKTLELNGCDGIETEVVEAVVRDCLGLERLVLPKQLEKESRITSLLVERRFKMKVVEEALVWERAGKDMRL